MSAFALCCAICVAAGAQSGPPSRIETLLRAMTLEEKMGQLVQRPGGRSKALNSKLDAHELDRIRAGKVGSYLHVAGDATAHGVAADRAAAGALALNAGVDMDKEFSCVFDSASECRWCSRYAEEPCRQRRSARSRATRPSSMR